jgi:hypothetical protein
MSGSTPFERAIDAAVDASDSVVRRYAPALQLPDEHEPEGRFRDLLRQCSIAEGIRWFPLCTYQGVALDVLDETSGMRTGTLKSIDGCVTLAACLARGYRRIVFETGGNTGAALTAYGQHAGVETFCVVPEENVSLLDSHLFAHTCARLIAVGDPAMVRPAAERLSARYGVPRVPQPTWRHLASRFRGSFVLEQLLRGERWTYFVQTISAAFGPIGIYDVLGEHDVPVPTFIGVQQAENCAMFTAWQAGSPHIRTTPVRSTAALLTPVMYDARPQTYGTFEQLTGLLTRTGGRLTTLDQDAFERTLSDHPAGKDVLSRLAGRGVTIPRRDGRIVERTGLIAITGALQEIDSGRIAPGSRVLCALTSGAGTSDGRAVPDLVVDDLSTLDARAAERWFGNGHA